jgi:hypothetical protein
MSLTPAPIPGSTALTANTKSSTQQSSAQPPRQSNIEKQGCLEATVLSVYDLPFSDRPVAVTLSSCGMTVKSGPPIARHKDRNSYRFATTGGGSSASSSSVGGGSSSTSPDLIKLVAPLRDLYKSMLTVRVTFANRNQYLETELPLRQLRIYENKWLILNLTPSPGYSIPPATPSSQGALTASSLPSTASSLPEEDSMAPPPTIRIKLKLSGP